MKWALLTYFAKWMMDTYDFVDEQMVIDNTGKAFDPYKLLHITNNGDFDTPLINNSFDRLAAKYHPNRVDKEKVPRDKAMKRW